MNAALPLVLIALPLVTSPAVYLAGHIRIRLPALMRWIGLSGLLATWLVFVQIAHDFSQYGTANFFVGMAAVRLDGLSLLLTGLALVVGTLVFLFSGPYMAGEIGEEKYYAGLLVLIGAMIGLAAAGDLFNLWVWFETMAVSSYLLVVFYRHQPASLEACVKYLVQSAAGSVLVLLGIALVLAQTATLNLSDIRLSEPSLTMLAAGALFIVGFGVKIAIVPLHTWLPDAHAQAPSGISAMLSGVVIEAGIVALLRALAPLNGAAVEWGSLFMGFGALNMLAGNLLALRQRQVKRLLAFSSVSHVGYMLLGLGIAIHSGYPAGAQAGFFHVLNHGLMKGLAFLAAGAFTYAFYIANGEHKTLTIADLAGAAWRYPIASIALSLAVLGLGGVPPLAGFMSKWQIFAAGLEIQDSSIIILVAFAALNTVLSLAYYLPLLNTLIRPRSSEILRHGQPLPLGIVVPLVVLGLLVVMLGLWPSLANWLTIPAGNVIFSLFSG